MTLKVSIYGNAFPMEFDPKIFRIGGHLANILERRPVLGLYLKKSILAESARMV